MARLETQLSPSPRASTETTARPTTLAALNTIVQSRRLVWLAGGLLTLTWFVVYLTTVSPTVNFIDSGELITALHEPGVTHPPGYPLYTLMGYVVSHILGGEVAWRINVLSAFWGAMAVGVLFLLLMQIQVYTSWLKRKRPPVQQPAKKRSKAAEGSAPAQTLTQPVTNAHVINWVGLLSAIAGASLLGTSATFWSRSVQAKMYTLHYFFVVTLFLLALNCKWAYERGDQRLARRWLIATAVVLGLSFTNHLITILLVPGLAVLLVFGRDWQKRIGWLLRQALYVVPAFIAPLLLYLYLPIRSSQGPIMNWGAPNTLPDFWRHVTGWQYSSYLGEDLNQTLGRFWNFLFSQWAAFSVPVIALSLAGAVLMARLNLALLLATATTGLATIVFSLKYGSSEMVPYIVPLYTMMVIWLASAPPNLQILLRQAKKQEGRMPRTANGTPSQKAQAAQGALGAQAKKMNWPLGAATLVAVLALATTTIQYPLQNHSNDHLAEQFALNVYNNLEPNSIILTDHWDLYSPSYYLQEVKGIRPDLVLVDKLLLKYPWYLGQLEQRYPWLVAGSKDIADPYKEEQHKWVNGQPYDGPKINKLYIDLLTSFVERNIAKRPAYVLFTEPCNPNQPPQYCENNEIASHFIRQPAGIAFRLLPTQPDASALPLPPMPKFDLRGFTYDKTPLDDFAKGNAGLYIRAYRSTAEVYAQANKADVAAELEKQAVELQNAIR